ncbi:sensor histidine kinase [uncultured Serinicoccus sp.]|uniref:sensor histidine kinase n=1 Tax=uncultured Serinicoccus sp. TaxID=735514 RepID=UPI0026047520|nr:histidine kinase [uncultured Serinicoccus sp.]
MTSATPTPPDIPHGRGWRLLIRGLGVLAIVMATVFDLGTTGVLIDDLYLVGGGMAPAWIGTTLVLAMGALLVVRYRYPVVALLGVAGISIGLTLVLEYAQPIFCLLVAIHAAARRGGPVRWWGSLALGLVQVPLIVRNVAKSFENPDLGNLLSTTTFFAALVFAAWAAATVERYTHYRTTALHDELDVRGERAARAERQRIGRELHDIVAHSVSAMMMQAAGARAMAGSVDRDHPGDQRLETVLRSLGTIESTGAQSMRELHRLLGVLRGDAAAEGTGGGLTLDQESSVQPGLGDLDGLVDLSRSSGLIVEVHRSGDPHQVDQSVGAAAYRVVQESLTNALKHAGHGALVDIYVAWHGAELQIQVRCRGSRDAARTDIPNGGTGLRGLRERVGLVGGRFEAGWAGDEFVGTAVLPTGSAEAPRGSTTREARQP